MGDVYLCHGAVMTKMIAVIIQTRQTVFISDVTEQPTSSTVKDNSSRCENNEFQCSPNVCISTLLVCDGINDCETEIDEKDCDKEINDCLGGQFMCGGGRCIPVSWRCDDENDCGDNTDETDCDVTEQPTSSTVKDNSSRCENNEFQCSPNVCISTLLVCDGINDCETEIDEKDCDKEINDCLGGQFMCGGGRCIPVSWRCDDENDCGDNTDETDCDVTEQPTSTTVKDNSSRCENNEFQCSPNVCISTLLVCDGINDCETEIDEKDCDKEINVCQDGEFPCTQGECIPLTWRCDGEDDCGDNEDETNCDVTDSPMTTRHDIDNSTCTINQFECSPKVCISKHWLCDGEVDCENSADEKDCDNGLIDLTITTTICDEDDFRCSDGKCIKMSARCDNWQDCVYGEDEANCSSDDAES
ncbi:hypothetical protein LSH36_21g02056, partial [Paralvinella palmiformis]